MSMHRTGWLVMSLLLTSGCAKMIDGFLVKGPIAQTLTLTDVDLACRSANANVPTALGVSERNPPRRALVILGATSALCSEFNAMEAELLAERSWFSLSGDARVASAIIATGAAAAAAAAAGTADALGLSGGAGGDGDGHVGSHRDDF
jgi:hypothetical protein